MPRPNHPNSPLTEVACEFRFHGSLLLLKQWGDFQEALRGEFPNLLVPSALAGSPPLLQPMHLSTGDQNERVLLALNSFAFVTRRYVDYPSFKTRLFKLHEVFQKFCRHGPLTRVGLRFLNALPPEFGEGDGLPGIVHPCLRLRLEELPAGVTLRGQPQLSFEQQKGKINLRVTIAAGQDAGTEITIAMPGGTTVKLPGGRHTILDLDAYIVDEVDSRSLAEQVDLAHGFLDEAFFSMVTPEYATYMKGNA